jgi:hypothetical protein
MKKQETKISVPDEIIMDNIYYLRDQKVMLDRDLAKLYGVETKVLNQAVKRNIDRFPDDFMFELNPKEVQILRSQIVTSSWGGARYLPMAFTEQGVAMLSSVLKSKKAIQVNIQIMRIFARVRQMLTDNTELRLEVEKIKKKVNNHDKSIELVFSYLDELLTRKEKPKVQKQIGFKIKGK